MKKLIPILFMMILLVSCSESEQKTAADAPTIQLNKEEKVFQKQLSLADYPDEASEWGEDVTNVKHSFQTDKREMALTFDACGGDFGNDVDEELLEFLIDEQIQATIFVNKRWAKSNEELFKQLANNDLFKIANHGTEHQPLSIDGGDAWGIDATRSKEEVVNEIMDNQEYIYELTGERMTLFRSGTAYYDEVAVSIANDLGHEVVNYDILGDAGATYSKEQVRDALMQADNGSIALLHMNQPSSGTAEGVKLAIPLLRDKGFEFTHIPEQQLQ
ncbi:MAG TPA: polysaccharide deacetylase family protein [Bacillota bacterium]|nr:polysaccharide deacetylase family protein [Bacillota bacterium]